MVKDVDLSECKDANSWKTLYNAAVIENHQEILDIPLNESGFPQEPVKYHRSCRSDFTHTKSLQAFKPSLSNDSTTATGSRKSRNNSAEARSAVLPDYCIICKKTKYKPKSKTREKIQSCVEFRADKTVRNSALLHMY